jgi:nucleoside-diphosphate-sugar epimerase
MKYFLKQNKTVLALDMKETAHKLEPHRNITYMQCDISDTTVMIHFARSGSAGKAHIDYNFQMKNVLNTVECLKADKKLGCHKFICAG